MKALTKLGPIVVANDINHESSMRYSTGIYFEEDCRARILECQELVLGLNGATRVTSE